ncbi:hypothetical protein TNCV_5091141 [Trichonephila clavipes]|nr:hypothetical protein TNCV_5091141 [Trichonephila clavipes]
MLIYELSAYSLKCRAEPNEIRRSFEPHDQMLYHRTILEPHTAYPFPTRTNYIVLTVKKPSLLPPPTPFMYRPKSDLWKKNLYLSKKRSKVRITPVMRCVSRRSEQPMAPVQIPQPPVQISQPPVQIPDVLQPVQIPDVLEPVQIPVSHVLEPPVQIPHVPEPPVQIPSVRSPTATYADCTCEYSKCSRTCADSSVISSTATYADSPRTYADSTCIRTCANSSIPSPTVTCENSSVTSLTVTCADSTCARTTCAAYPSESSILWTLWSRQMHSTSSCRLYLDPKNSSCFTRNRDPTCNLLTVFAYVASNGNRDPTGNVDQPTPSAYVDSNENRDPTGNVGIKRK